MRVWLTAQLAFALALDEQLSLLQHSREKILAPPSAGSTLVSLATPFRKALVLSIDPEAYKVSEATLRDQGVAVERVLGFDGSKPQQVQAALDLLKRYGCTDSLHSTVSNAMLCLHTSPGRRPDFGAASSEFWRNVFRRSARTVEELLERDKHDCVPRVVSIAAAHVRLWEGLAKKAKQDEWYLVMEEDADLCPQWRRRLLRDLPRAPKDAEILKLYFFGHWRKEDAVEMNSTEESPFLSAVNPLNGWDLFKASSYELLHGSGWSDVPVAGFYAGTQAYLVRPTGARKLLEKIRNQPFQDIDMTMISSVKNYVWRKVLAHVRPENLDLLQSDSLLQGVPECNQEPPNDQYW